MAYGAGDLLVRAVMKGVTGLPKDVVINDFAFTHDSGAPSDANITALFGHVSDFYRAAQAGGDQLGGFIGAWVDRAATHTLQAYTIVSGSLGSPRLEEDWLGPSGANSGIGLPQECAGVLSFHGDLTGLAEESGSTRPKARRRGRVYIGPIDQSAIDTTTPEIYLKASFTLCMRQAATKMADDAAGDGWTWSVWSRANTTLYPVVGGWTDNAPDTQRRRGVSPSARTVYTI